MQECSEFSSDKALQRYLEKTYFKDEIKVSRIRNKLAKIIDDESVYEFYRSSHAQKIRERDLLALVYCCSCKFKEWEKTLSIEKNIKNNMLSYYEVSNLMVSKNAKSQEAKLDFYMGVSDKLADDEYDYIAFSESEGITKFNSLLSKFELLVQNFINIFQRLHFEFKDCQTLMTSGLEDAILLARKIIESQLQSEKTINYTEDSLAATVLKFAELNTAHNQIATKISSNEYCENCDWFDSKKFVKLYKEVTSTNSLDLALIRTFELEELPSNFHNLVKIALCLILPSRYAASSLDKQKVIFESILDDLDEYLPMAFIVISDIQNKTHIKVNVPGSTNPSISVSHVLKQYQIWMNNPNRISSISPDIVQFIANRYMALTTAVPKEFLFTISTQEFQLKLQDYFKYRRLKHELILELYPIFRQQSVKSLKMVVKRFYSEARRLLCLKGYMLRIDLQDTFLPVEYDML